MRAGKARYVGISSYSAAKTVEAATITQSGTPLVIESPSYSLLNRWMDGLTTELTNARASARTAFTALAQGLLTDRYLKQPAGEIERATGRPTFDDDRVTDEVLDRLREATAGQIAPDLTHIATRSTLGAGTLPNTPENLAIWIRDPQRVKPGNQMPPNPLAAEDLQALVAYLETLR